MVPSVAIKEIMEDVDHIIPTILRMRAFANTKNANDRAKKWEDRPTGRMANLVTEIEFEEVKKIEAALRAEREQESDEDSSA